MSTCLTPPRESHNVSLLQCQYVKWQSTTSQVPSMSPVCLPITVKTCSIIVMMQVAQRMLAVELAAAVLQAYPEPFDPGNAVMAPSRSSRRTVCTPHSNVSSLTGTQEKFALH